MQISRGYTCYIMGQSALYKRVGRKLSLLVKKLEKQQLLTLHAATILATVESINSVPLAMVRTLHC